MVPTCTMPIFIITLSNIVAKRLEIGQTRSRAKLSRTDLEKFLGHGFDGPGYLVTKRSRDGDDCRVAKVWVVEEGHFRHTMSAGLPWPHFYTNFYTHFLLFVSSKIHEISTPNYCIHLFEIPEGRVGSKSHNFRLGASTLGNVLLHNPPYCQQHLQFPTHTSVCQRPNITRIHILCLRRNFWPSFSFPRSCFLACTNVRHEVSTASKNSSISPRSTPTLYAFLPIGFISYSAPLQGPLLLSPTLSSEHLIVLILDLRLCNSPPEFAGLCGVLKFKGEEKLRDWCQDRTASNSRPVSRVLSVPSLC
jgi:hypothetical protein